MVGYFPWLEEEEGVPIIFPAIEIENEIEKNQDTTCLDTNRDEFLKSFCSFTSDLDDLFNIQNIPKKAKSFWPNIWHWTLPLNEDWRRSSSWSSQGFRVVELSEFCVFDMRSYID